MRKRSILLLVIFCFNLMGCLPKSAPGIIYTNISRGGGVVKNIKVDWGKFYVHGASEVRFCSTNTQFMILDHDSDFFGTIHIEWENAKGEKLIKDLVLTKEQLPSFKNRHKPDIFSNVTVYFTQSDVHLYTSDTPNLEQIEADLYKKAGLTCQQYRDQEYIKTYGKKCLEQGCDDAISMYESMPKDSPLRNDPEFIAEYKKEKAKRTKK